MDEITINIILAFFLTIPVSYLLIKAYNRRVDKLINQNTNYESTQIIHEERVSCNPPQIKYVDKLVKPTGLLHTHIILPYIISSALTAMLLFLFTYNYLGKSPFDFRLTLLLSFYIFTPALLLLNFYYRFSYSFKRKVFNWSVLSMCSVTLYLIIRNYNTQENVFFSVLMLFFLYASIPFLFWLLTKISKTKELIFISFPISIVVGSLLMMFINLMASDTNRLQSIFEPLFNVLYLFNYEKYSLLAFHTITFAIALTIIYFLALGIRKLFRLKKINNLIIMMDGVWIFHILWITKAYNNSSNALWFILGLFILYKMLVHFSYKILNRHNPRPNQRLLVLRVFALADKGFTFFEKLKTYWAPKGSIQLIAGYDLTDAVLDIDDILYFMSGNMQQRFNLNDALIENNIAQLDFEPDVDYRYRVNEMYCNNSTWQTVLQALVSKTDFVIMDIRQFTRQNNGSALEIQVLMQKIPLQKILFIINQATDIDFFNELILNCFAALPSQSPNINTTEPIQVLQYNTDADFDYLITHFEKKRN